MISIGAGLISACPRSARVPRESALDHQRSVRGDTSSRSASSPAVRPLRFHRETVDFHQDRDREGRDVDMKPIDPEPPRRAQDVPGRTDTQEVHRAPASQPKTCGPLHAAVSRPQASSVASRGSVARANRRAHRAPHSKSWRIVGRAYHECRSTPSGLPSIGEHGIPLTSRAPTRHASTTRAQDHPTQVVPVHGVAGVIRGSTPSSWPRRQNAWATSGSGRWPS
jgi:hypothetical protein